MLFRSCQINTNSASPNTKGGHIEFRGTKGTLYITWSGYEIVPEVLTPNEFPARSPLTRVADRDYRKGAKAEIEAKSSAGKDSTNLHARNFLDCVKSRKKCNCDIEIGHRSTSATILGNIAHRTKTYLEWDAKTEQFANSQAANKHLSYPYRPPYKLEV